VIKKKGINFLIDNMYLKGKELIESARNGEPFKVKQLLLEGVNVDHRDQFQYTPCCWAAINGHTDVVKILLDHGANINLYYSNGWTHCHMAAHYGQLDTLKFLIYKGALFETLNYIMGDTPRAVANRNGHKDVVAYLDAVVISIDNARRAVLFLVGIRRSGRNSAPLNPLSVDNKAGMGDLQYFPKEIVLMIAKYIWATRRDDEWQRKCP
jgi:hypothetical protein